MHIGYVLTTFPALSETFVLNEMLELDRQGVTITVFSLREPRNEPRHASLGQLRARIVYFKDSPVARPSFADISEGAITYVKALLSGQFDELKNISRAIRIAAAARRQGVEALHAHFADRPASLAYWAHRMTGLPFSLTAHAIDIFEHGLRDKLMVTKLREARFAITVCDFNKKFILDHYPGVPAENVHVINNCVDTSYFAFRDSQVADSPNILSVGRLVPKKGFDLLIAACARLREMDKPIRMTIVGEGPERESLEKLIASVEVSDLVTLAGAGSHAVVRGLMSEATIFCMPFRRTKSGDQDSLSLVLIEAMASGVPVISTRLAAIPEIVDDGVNGLLVDPEDPSALATAIARLVDSTELRTRFAAAARQKVETRFLLSKNVSEIRSLMETT